MDGKELISTEDMMNKVRFAREASDKYSEGHFMICARTDAAGVYGLEESINRSKKYIDAGADMIFPEGLSSLDDFRTVSNELRKYKKDVLLLANMTEFGKTPYITLEEFD